jgi:hypothetical protein
MRAAWITAANALNERLQAPAQVQAPVAEAEMPAYMESFLAHLRLLVGVPFEYLVPDSRLLPDESIRFFYLDRSWTDRLVDGAISVGKIGSREQAHHQAQSATVNQQLDVTERGVRDLQRNRVSFTDLRDNPRAGAAQVITGFLLRSAAVSGWPQMDVRAYNTSNITPGYDPSKDPAKSAQLTTLRLERLSPGVLLALFQGIPKLVVLEEPHHGVQFGVKEQSPGVFYLFRRDNTGKAYQDQTHTIPVPVRQSNGRVLAIADLRRRHMTANPANPPITPQDGSAPFAIEMLNPPWRQRFEGTGGAPAITGSGAFQASYNIAVNIKDVSLQNQVQLLVKP